MKTHYLLNHCRTARGVIASRLKGDVARDDLHNDFSHNTAFQHCCNIFSNVYNIVPTLQRCAVLKIVLVNRSVQGGGGGELLPINSLK